MKVRGQESGVRSQESGGKKSRQYAVCRKIGFSIPHSAFRIPLFFYCLLLTAYFLLKFMLKKKLSHFRMHAVQPFPHMNL